MINATVIAQPSWSENLFNNASELILLPSDQVLFIYY